MGSDFCYDHKDSPCVHTILHICVHWRSNHVELHRSRGLYALPLGREVSLLEERYCLWETYPLASPWLWAHVRYCCSPQKETYPHTPQQWHSDPWLIAAHTCLDP